VRGRVRLICDGRYRNRGPMARGEVNHMGPTAVLDTGKVEIVVISNHVEPHDLAAFQAVGIDPASKRYLMLKSRVHWRAGLRAWPARWSNAPAPGCARRTMSDKTSRVSAALLLTRVLA
jgi:microcystin degradation protein MlrC